MPLILHPLSPPPGPLAKDIIGAESVPAGASEQQPSANPDKEVAASKPLSAIEEPVGEVTSRVAGSKTLIDLEEEPAAIADTDLPT